MEIDTEEDFQYIICCRIFSQYGKYKLVSNTFKRILSLVNKNEVKVSEHGYEELSADGITFRELVEDLPNAKIVEDYPDYYKGPCVLVLETGRNKNPIHALWGIPKNQSCPAVLITAYCPDPGKWSLDFMRRK